MSTSLRSSTPSLGMANLTAERGACTPPFLQLDHFGTKTGCKRNKYGRLAGLVLIPVQTPKADSALLCPLLKALSRVAFLAP